jgi:transposase
MKSLEQNNLKATLVQAVRVRQYARAAGILAKTDKIDAKVLAAFGSAMQPKPTEPPSAEQKRLRELEAQRRHLSRVLLGEENRLEQMSCAELRSLSRSLINKIKKQIALLDARIERLIAQDQTLCAKAQKLTAISGVGTRTAALLLAQMPELGQLNRRQARHLWWTTRSAQRPLHGRALGRSLQSNPVERSCQNSSSPSTPHSNQSPAHLENNTVTYDSGTKRPFAD